MLRNARLEEVGGYMPFEALRGGGGGGGGYVSITFITPFLANTACFTVMSDADSTIIWLPFPMYSNHMFLFIMF